MTRKAYQPPHLHQYGPIGDHTFNTPGGIKRCRTGCHTDMFNEQSASTTS
jgi:hypothetical protein